MSYYESFITKVKEGKKGFNVGIPYTVDRLNMYSKIRWAKYTLVIAPAGVGKSSWVYDQYMFNTLDHVLQHGNKDVFNLFYNLEIENDDIIGVLIARYIYTKHGILTDKNQLFSAEEDNKFIHDKIEHIIESDECKQYVQEFEKRTCIFTKCNRKKIEHDIDILYSEGKLCDEGGREKKLPTAQNKIVNVILDHIGLVVNMKGENDYNTLVHTSGMLVRARNKYKCSPIVVQQITPQKDTFDSKQTVIYNHQDLRGGKETIQDCDLALSIGSPFKADKETYAGYKILPTPANENLGLKERIRVIKALKNRGGALSDEVIASFIGEIGKFSNMSKSPNNADTAFYKAAMNLKKTYT